MSSAAVSCSKPHGKTCTLTARALRREYKARATSFFHRGGFFGATKSQTGVMCIHALQQSLSTVFELNALIQMQPGCGSNTAVDCVRALYKRGVEQEPLGGPVLPDGPGRDFVFQVMLYRNGPDTKIGLKHVVKGGQLLVHDIVTMAAPAAACASGKKMLELPRWAVVGRGSNPFVVQLLARLKDLGKDVSHVDPSGGAEPGLPSLYMFSWRLEGFVSVRPLSSLAGVQSDWFPSVGAFGSNRLSLAHRPVKTAACQPTILWHSCAATSPRKYVLLDGKGGLVDQHNESMLRQARSSLAYLRQDDLLAAVTDADAMIIRSDIVDQAVLDKAAKMKIVVRAGAGYDNIDLKACEGKEITAMNTPGQNANAVAELVFGMMIVSARNNFDGTSGFELVNREIAFYGFGAVARAVHKLAQGFGMKSFAYDPYIPADKIKEMGAEPVATVAGLFEHQYVSLHVPLTDETKASINKELLGKMPKGGTLINTARLEVVHEADMIEVLKTRPDFCYLCDVAPKELAYGKRLIFTKKKMGAQTAEEQASDVHDCWLLREGRDTLFSESLRRPSLITFAPRGANLFLNEWSEGVVVKEDQICSVNGEREVDVMKQLLKTESEIMLEFQRRRCAEYAEPIAS
eukprot:s4290_g3.t2